MSITVIGQVRTFSRSEHAERLVLWTIADNAGDDGVAYPPIQDRCPSCAYAYLDKDGVCESCLVQLDEPKRKSISCGTRLTEGTVREAIKALQLKGELQVGKARRGRSLINVYRVTVGWLREIEPNYDDLPFKLNEPFPSLPSNFDGSHAGNSASPDQDPNLDANEGLPSNSDGSRDPSFSARPPSKFRSDYRGNSDLTTVEIPGPTRARVIGASREPSEEPSTDESQRTTLVPATAGERVRRVDQLKWELTLQLGCKPVTRSEHGVWGKAIGELVDAGADPDELRRRVVVYRRRWPNVALTPMALVRWWGFLGVAVEAKTCPHEAWLEQSSWLLEPEDAHWIVDSWTDVTDDERARFHERVDAIRTEREAKEAAA